MTAEDGFVSGERGVTVCTLCQQVSELGWRFWLARWSAAGLSLPPRVGCCAFLLKIAGVCWIYSERYQHCTCKWAVSNCVSQWPITSITGYLHNAFPIMHADRVIACTNGVSDCRCKSVDGITCGGTAESDWVRAAVAPGTTGLLGKAREVKPWVWPPRILLPAGWNCLFVPEERTGSSVARVVVVPPPSDSRLRAGRGEHLDVFV